MFWQNLENRGGEVALIEENGICVSYAELAAAADASGFAGGPRRLVLIELSNTVSAIAAYLGALRAGHAVILANAGSDDAFAALRERYRPELVWTSAGLEVLAEAPSERLHPDLAVMLSTSGSTGSSKLVRLSAAAVEANARSIADYLNIGTDGRAITSLPPAYSYGLSVINSHLAAGASLVLTGRSVVDPVFRELIDRHAVRSMAGVPYSYEMLEASGFLAEPPDSLRTLTQAGGRLAPERVQRIAQAAAMHGIRFYVMYGQTEATARMAYLPPEYLGDYPDCIGIAIPGGVLSLRDPDTAEPRDDAGELVYSGPNVMMGYGESRHDLARGAEVAVLATGDLAEVRGPGLFRITGRKSRFVKLFGLRIALDEVERAAAERGWETIVAGDDSHLVLATEDARDPADLADALAARYKLPADRILAVRFDAIPRLASGKPDYRTILAAAPSPEGKGHGLDQYVALLERLARPARVDEGTSFEAVGGDSLNYVEASMILERVLGDLPDGWERMSVGELMRRAPATAPARTGRAAWISLDQDIIVRVVAIVAIILGHGFGLHNELLKGGADVLLMTAGLALARFNSKRLIEGQAGRVLLDIILRYILLYYAILIAFDFLRDSVRWQDWLLINNYFRRPANILTFYWFIEAWFQAVLVFAALFAIPPVRRLAGGRPVALAVALLAGAAALKVGGNFWSDPDNLRYRSLDQIFCFVAAGWAMVNVKNAAGRFAIIAFAVTCSATSWGLDNTRPWLMLAATSFLAFGPRLRVPPAAAMLLRSIAMASFYIYIFGTVPTHIVWEKFAEAKDLERALVMAVHLVATLALGVAAYRAYRFAEEDILARLRDRLRESWQLRRRGAEMT